MTSEQLPLTERFSSRLIPAELNTFQVPELRRRAQLLHELMIAVQLGQLVDVSGYRLFKSVTMYERKDLPNAVVHIDSYPIAANNIDDFQAAVQDVFPFQDERDAGLLTTTFIAHALALGYYKEAISKPELEQFMNSHPKESVTASHA